MQVLPGCCNTQPACGHCDENPLCMFILVCCPAALCQHSGAQHSGCAGMPQLCGMHGPSMPLVCEERPDCICRSDSYCACSASMGRCASVCRLVSAVT